MMKVLLFYSRGKIGKMRGRYMLDYTNRVELNRLYML